MGVFGNWPFVRFRMGYPISVRLRRRRMSVVCQWLEGDEKELWVNLFLSVHMSARLRPDRNDDGFFFW